MPIMFANALRTRSSPNGNRWSSWIYTSRCQQETDPALAHRHIEQDVAPQMAATDQFLHTEWFSNGVLIPVDTAQGETDPEETRQEHIDRHEALVQEKLVEFPIDT